MNPHVEVEIARRTLVDGWQSPGGQSGRKSRRAWGTAQYKDHDQFKEPFGRWQTLPSRILTASPHLQGYDVPGEEIDRLKAEGLTLLEALEELGIA